MKFTSKKDWWLVIIVWVPVMIAWSLLLENFMWLHLLGNAALTGVVALFWFGTYYVVKEETLIVSMGGTRKKIPIECITSLRASHSIVSSAALSLDRIEINYRETDLFPDVVYVSSEDKMRFVTMLCDRNPKIELDEKIGCAINGDKSNLVLLLIICYTSK